MDRRLKKQLKTLQKYRKFLLPIFSGFICISILLVFIISRIHYRQTQAAATPSFHKAVILSGWAYQSNSASPLQVSVKSTNADDAVKIQYQQSDVSFGVPLANATVSQSKPNELEYTTKSKEVRVKYTIEPSRLKEAIILAQAPKSNLFTIPLKLNKAEIQLSPDNTPVIVDSKDKHYLFHIEKPFAVDANGVVTYAAKYRLETKDKQPKTLTYGNDPGKMTLLGAFKPISIPSKQYRLILEVDSEWLNDPARAYPVTIDPTVVHDTTSEFATGQLNRVTDTGSGSSPSLETYYQELPADINTVGLWHFNESSGNALDSSDNSLTGTPTGTTVIPGILNNARGFNGSSDTISMGTGMNTSFTNLSVSAWIKTTATATTSIIERGGWNTGEFALYLSGGTAGTIRFQAYDLTTNNYVDSTMLVNDGQWHHIAGVYNGSLLSIYIDGTLNVTKQASGIVAAETEATYIGSRTGTLYYWNGLLDEVRISNIARSPEQIRADAARRPSSTYTSNVIDFSKPISSWNPLSWTEVGVSTGDGETPLDTTGLVAQWNFNETSGTTAASGGTCGASCNGTLTNFASTASQDQAALTGWTSINRRWGVGALMLDGSNDYVDAGTNNVYNQTSYTLSGWIKTSDASDYKCVTSKNTTMSDRSWWICVWKNGAGTYNNGALVWRASAGGVSNVVDVGTTTNVADGQWHYFATVLNGTVDARLYLDGKLVAIDSSITTTVDVPSTAFIIGNDPTGTTRFFNGSIDAVQFYSRALTASEVLSNYNSGAVELQTRVGASADPNDGTWEAWSPSTGETQLLSLDSDSANWAWDSTATYMPKLLGYGATVKQEGASSLKFSNQTQVDANTVGLWHFDETSGTGAYLKDSTGYISPFATGGTITYTDSSGLNPRSSPAYAGGYTVHTFTSSSSLVVNGSGNVDVLVVGGGGGGGGAGAVGAGGGAGGVRAVTGQAVTPGVKTVTIGIGGAGGNPSGTSAGKGTNGGDSVFDSLTATGGGGGGTGGSTYGSGITGGSGGGSTNGYAGASGTSGQGNAGGSGYSGSNYGAGGGGGAGGTGVNGTATTGGTGGAGTSSSLSGAAVTYATGGGGSTYGGGTPGGGGSSNVNHNNGVYGGAGQTATANTGSGGGGSGHSAASVYSGGAGGSGIVIVRYPSSYTGSYSHGTPTGATVTQGISGKARSFNGSSDYVLIPASPAFDLQQLTIEAWVNPTIVAQNGFIFEKTTNGSVNTQYSCFLNGDGTFYFRTYNSSGTADDLTFTSSTYITANKWNHIACTYNGSTKAVYVNGTLAASKSYSQVLQTNPAGTSIIGAYGSGTSYFFSGKIDELRISNTARSAEEIAEAYRMGRDHYLNRTISSTDLSGSNLASIKVAADRPGNYLAMTYGESAFANYQSDANTAALYHLDEQSGSGAYVKDAGPNAYHATPTGTTATQGKIGKGRYFNGTSSDYLPLSSSLDTPIKTGTFTISGWLNAISFTNEAVLLTRGLVSTGGIYYGMAFNMSSTGLNFNRWVGSAAIPELIYAFTPTTNTWYFAAVSYDKSTGATNLYINGQLVKSGTLSTSNVVYNASYDLGYVSGALRRNVSDRYSNAIIDELRIDSSVRSADDIRQAYESGLRSHPIVIDFGAKLDAGNLITSTSDTSFTIDATALGLNQKGSSLFLGDKIIVKENVNGTEYLAQGTVNAVAASTGITTVSAWDSGSTVPSGGFTINATVFKWQTEYLNLNKSMSDQRNAITNLTLRLTDGNEGRTVYLDDFRSITNYLTANTGSTITSSLGNRYLQYRTILASADEYVSPSLTSVTLDYNQNTAPSIPTLDPSFQADKVKTPDQTPEFRFTTTDPNSDDVVYEIQWDTNTAFSSATSKVSDADPGFSNITTPADTSPFNAGNTISFIPQSNLTNNTTHFYRVRVKDPSGSDTWTDWSLVKSFTIDTSLLHNQWHETHASQFATDTITGDTTISTTNHNVTVPEAITISETVDAMEYTTDTTAQAAYVTNGSAIESGGTITYTDSSGANPRSSPRYPGGYAVHTFTGSGTFTSSYSKSISSLIVAGGGGGGTVTNTTQNPTGGGGAGGVLTQTQTVAAGSYSITVGDGGAHSSAGGNSVFNSLTAIGGGRGGGSYAGYTGGNGGSGGGSATTGYAAGSGTSGQGNAGGAGSDYYGGSGGGAGTAASATTSGDGIASSISGVSAYYGGGGGQGSLYSGSAGGLGGGGAGGRGDGSGTAGTPNTGGGGGGSGGNYWTTGGAGGSGIVILRYPSDPYLESYSEATIKTSGSYALKGVAAITNSLNKTLTRTISSPLDLSNMSHFTFDIRSTRTGSNIKIGLHDSGGTTTEVTPNITSANAFQSISLDISGVANTNKDAIDKIIITIVNANAANTFYIDNLQSFYSVDGIGAILSTPITASTIRTASRWKTFIANQSNIDNNVTYQIYYDVTGVPTIVPDSALPGNSSGFSTLPVNLTSLTTASYPTLYIKANLSYTSISPTIDDWTVSLNEVPQTPTLNSPTDTTINQPPLTVFTTTGTDIDLDNLQYKITLCTDAVMTQNCQSIDQTSSQTGWSATSYVSGTPATHTLQAPLLPDTTYYWKTSSIDPDGTNIWSATQTAPYSFTTKPTPTAASACRIQESGTNTSLTPIWTDTATNEDMYEIRRSVDGGAFTTLTTLAANSLTFTDTTVTSGHTYAYGIAPYLLGPVYGTWCVTPTLSLQSGSTSFSGLKMQGIQIK